MSPDPTTTTDVLRVAVVQQPAPTPGTATADAERHIRDAARAGAEIVVLPELWNTGYRLPTRAEASSAAFRAGVRQARDDFLGRLTELARELATSIVATHVGVTDDALADDALADDALTNSAALLGHDGTVLCTYSKVHLARFAGEDVFAAGRRLAAVDVPRPRGGTVRTGLLICYDRVFPEAGRTLAADGAELVLIPNAGPLCANRSAQIRVRSFENQYAVAVANYPGAPMGGGSMACDGIAFSASGTPRDLLLWQAGTTPSLGIVDIPLAQLREYRATQPWGLPDRVPAAYRH